MPREHKSSHSPPPEDEVFRILREYQGERLTLEEAAPRLRDALKKLKGGINLSMPPSARRLFAEAAKLDGNVFPTYEPDPQRHADGGRDFLQGLLDAWREVRNDVEIREPLSIYYHFAALSESAARSIAGWLESQGQERVQVQSPAEADDDDWRVYAWTPSIRWNEAEFNRWVQIVRRAPLGDGEASFTGWSM